MTHCVFNSIVQDFVVTANIINNAQDIICYNVSNVRF